MLGTLTAAGALSILAACASTPKPTPVEVVDWTDRACESPAYRSILGSYVGVINYRDNEARACRWNTEISIIGVSMVADCSLTGTIVATPVESSGNGYVCSTVNTPTKFVVGLSDTDLNRYGPSSVILHLEEQLPLVGNDGASVLNPIVQYESITAENGTLVTDAGNILNRQP